MNNSNLKWAPQLYSLSGFVPEAWDVHENYPYQLLTYLDVWLNFGDILHGTIMRWWRQSVKSHQSGWSQNIIKQISC